MRELPVALLTCLQFEFLLAALLICALLVAGRLLKKQELSETKERVPPGPSFLMILKSSTLSHWVWLVSHYSLGSTLHLLET